MSLMFLKYEESHPFISVLSPTILYSSTYVVHCGNKKIIWDMLTSSCESIVPCVNIPSC